MLRLAPRVLLLVNSNPAGSGVGELFLREIGLAYPAGRLVRYSAVQRRELAGEATWLGFRSITRYVATARWPGLSSLREWLFAVATEDRMVEEIVALVADEKIDLVWAVLSNGPIIRVAERIARSRVVPMVSTVLDDPEYFGRNQMLDPLTRRYMMAQFSAVLGRTVRISVISESMRDYYQNRYGVQSIIMRHGIDERLYIDWNSNRLSRGIIKIGFAGSLYAKNEWNALLRAIDSKDGRIAGKEVRVYFIGRFPRIGAKISACVERLGPMSFESTLRTLGTMSMAYLPYWFDARNAMAARTSFPGKLSAYAASGLPVLYHGPRDSSAARFLGLYPFGVCCHSLDEPAIYEAIVRIVGDTGFSRCAGEARAQALDQELSRSVMLGRFCELVDCDTGELGPTVHSVPSAGARSESMPRPRGK